MWGRRTLVEMTECAGNVGRDNGVPNLPRAVKPAFTAPCNLINARENSSAEAKCASLMGKFCNRTWCVRRRFDGDATCRYVPS